ncbi:ArnT family glycosyltransferase [Leptospira sp. GIMC2001]|uniref:ArnT family glycosyltransferase n=1 Tax=Leptospira sp. GIMC2001 TaxID=1513297 RepID=UPI0004A5C62D|nr:glycosyltransferase family 39 protein [Leptospira sp. GIMC2001]AID56198.1 polymyxin resistance protein ArnT [Leptospira sp. GIMC2001]WCL50329.1 glycosyltransferase family 39 protein [Leptospira sp. GIMC2001]
MKLYISALLLISALFLSLGVELWDQDESAYMGFASEMIRTNDWVVPSFPISEPHRKTPLHFWTGAIGFTLFGEHVEVLRSINVIYFLLTGFVIFLLSRSIFPDEKYAELPLISTSVFLTGLFLPIYSKIALTDMGLLFWQILGIYFLWKTIESDSWKSSIPWVLGLWFTISLGVLQKGPPIIILLGGISALLLIFLPSRIRILRLNPWFFLPIALFPVLIWGRLAWIATDGVFIRWLVDWYILKRAGGSVFGQTGPPGIYLILFFFFLVPWSIFLPNILIGLWNDAKDFIKGKRQLISLFLLSWAAIAWIFYEVLPSKLPSYVLATYPLFSILIAKSILDKKKVNNYETSISIFLILVWLTLLSYILLPNIGVFGNTQNSYLNYLAIASIVFCFLYIIWVVWRFKCDQKESKIIDWRSLTLSMSIFHFVFTLVYYPILGNARNYPTEIVNLLPLSPLNSVDTEFRKIFIHSDIRLASIVYKLKSLGITPENITVLDGTMNTLENYKKNAGTYLVPADFLEVLSLTGFTPASKCHEFYSYESGKLLKLCWVSK